MIVKLLTEHHFEFLSLKGGCRGSSESKLIKMQRCWKSHALAQMKQSQHQQAKGEARNKYPACRADMLCRYSIEEII